MEGANAAREPEMAERVRDLQDIVGKLETQSETLITRLLSVSRPIPPSELEKTTSAGSDVPLAQDMISIESRIRGISHTIADILDRLEV
jgi:hypothetical protein